MARANWCSGTLPNTIGWKDADWCVIWQPTEDMGEILLVLCVIALSDYARADRIRLAAGVMPKLRR